MMGMKWIAVTGFVAALLTGCGGPLDDVQQADPGLPQETTEEVMSVGDSKDGVEAMKNSKGQCCNARCRNAITRYYNVQLVDGQCTDWMNGFCWDRGGLDDAWWGSCS
ncbi:hypothetical protein [Myxococcus sp. XM-1-1-1]|uniref:hypothetical protein n=1 Tax=Myxococcus sp. XM-1-1-1 TaxID=2874602 RepID=UPI001CBFFB5A|nr:hypothetical protein [Myxococcus sp. XM-1-1-1]